MLQLNVVAFNSSPRKSAGNTSRMVQRLFAKLEAEGIGTQEVCIGGTLLRGCIGCRKCRDDKLGQCVFSDDPLNGWIDLVKKADGIVLASPTYFASINTEMKAFIDRVGFSAQSFLHRKVGAPVVVARRGGAIQTYNTLMAFFGIARMIVPMSSYWNMGYGLMPGDVLNDGEALTTMDNLGENMAWVMKKLA
jgi:multimeric flavodoxin WrbA